jgi:hypothetical protein
MVFGTSLPAQIWHRKSPLEQSCCIPEATLNRAILPVAGRNGGSLGTQASAAVSEVPATVERLCVKSFQVRKRGTCQRFADKSSEKSTCAGFAGSGSPPRWMNEREQT